MLNDWQAERAKPHQLVALWRPWLSPVGGDQIAAFIRSRDNAMLMAIMRERVCDQMQGYLTTPHA